MESNEEWRPVKGFEEVYMISNHGNLKRLPVWMQTGKTGRWLSEERVRYPNKPKQAHSYIGVLLSYKGKKRATLMHRLVAEAFIPNPDNKPFVNHKDLVKYHNHVSNLEWVTHSENTKHWHQNVKRPSRKEVYLKTFGEEYCRNVLGLNYSSIPLP